MNRYDEFTAYRNELDETPPQLESTIVRAKAKLKKRQNVRKYFMRPVYAMCSLLIAFIIAVNVFPQAALAMSEKTPILKELISAVSFDPSMKRIIENGYVQNVSQTSRMDEVEIKVEYLVMDETSLTVFFTSSAPKGMCIQHAEVDIKKDFFGIAEGLDLNEKKDLHELTFSFGEPVKKFPSDCEMIIQLIGEEGYYKTMVITLYPDNNYLKDVKKISINKKVDILDQTIYIDHMECYPTKSILYFRYKNKNTAFFTDINFYMEDETGNRYTCMDSSWRSDDFEILSQTVESPYFSNADQITIVIDKIMLVNKDKQYGLIDYATKSIENMPENVSIDSMELDNGKLKFTLRIKDNQDEAGVPAARQYRDKANTIYNLNFIIGGSEAGFNFRTFSIDNYEEGRYSIIWFYAPAKVLETPIRVTVDLNK